MPLLQDPILFLATDKPESSLIFYRDVLEFKFIEDTPFALVFDMGGRSLRIQKVETHTALPYTSAGWKVHDIAETVAALVKKGISFERYPWMKQDESGVWRTDDGASIAWFKDPCDNLLSITEFP